MANTAENKLVPPVWRGKRMPPMSDSFQVLPTIVEEDSAVRVEPEEIDVS